MLKGPQPLVRMRMDQGQTPMISVPTRVLEEFSTNSPSPPTAAVDSPKATAPTRTPSPDIPNKLSDSALPTDTSSVSDTSKYINGMTNGSDVSSENTNTTSDTCDKSKSDVLPTVPAPENAESTKLPVDPTENKLNGTISPSLKRPIEEQSEGTLQDLKKFRVSRDSKLMSFTPEFSSVEESKTISGKPKEVSETGDADEIMCLSSNDSSLSTIKDERTSSESKKPEVKSSIFDVLLPKKEEKPEPKLEDKKLESKISISDSSKENSSPLSSDLEVLTPASDSKVGRRLRKLPRKELEKLILRLFSEKTLYECELGRQKQLCEKLETTLEANRKKTAQFHKEIEDLKKVTSRLSSEQQSRKGQFVAPIRIKRSVGIQAAPHIINKGIHHAQNSGIKTISPRQASVKSGSGRMQQSPNTSFQTKGRPTQSIGGMVPGVTSLSNASLPVGQPPASIGTIRPASGQMMMLTQSAPGMMQALPRPAVAGTVGIPVTSNKVVIPVIPGGKVVRSSVVPISNIIPSGSLNQSQRPMLLQNQTVTATTSAISTPVVSKGSGVVDLTADEGRGAVGRNQTVMSTAGALVKVPVSGTQLVAIPQATGMVLVPSATPGTTLVSGQTVNNVGNPVVVQARQGPVSSPRVMGTSASFRPAPAPVTSPSVGVPQHKHPAPLPRTPVQQVAGITKKLPPQPTLKLSHKENSIVLSWTMSKTEDHESIASYQLYAYQEGNSPPSAALWKKVGSVKALELPMACTLTQFMPGHVYHFAVRAVDTKSRLGPFSEPRSIRLEKT